MRHFVLKPDVSMDRMATPIYYGYLSKSYTNYITKHYTCIVLCIHKRIVDSCCTQVNDKSSVVSVARLPVAGCRPLWYMETRLLQLFPGMLA